MFAMKYSTIYVILSLVILSTHSYESDALVEDTIEVLKLGKEIVTGLLQTWKLIDQTDIGDIQLPFLKEKQAKILSRISELGRKIDMVENQVSHFLCLVDFVDVVVYLRFIR